MAWLAGVERDGHGKSTLAGFRSPRDRPPGRKPSEGLALSGGPRISRSSFNHKEKTPGVDPPAF